MIEATSSDKKRLVDEWTDAPRAGYPGTLKLDVAKYRRHIDHFDISEKQKIELLQTLWSIMRSFAELGYGVDNVQRVIPALAEFSSRAESDALELNVNSELFNASAKEGEQDR
jgi:hypothetical protein